MKKVVIIGSSALAIGAINKFLRLENRLEITIISKEEEFPYNKCFLVDNLAKLKTEDQLYTKPQDFFEKNGINLILGKEALQINRLAKTVVLSDGQSINYDELVLGMGSSALKLSVSGAGSKGVFYFHTLADLSKIKEFISANSVQKAIVVGAGFTGLECADALNTLGLNVTIVEGGSQLLPRFLDLEASRFVEKQVAYKGARLQLNSRLNSIVSDDDKAKGVLLDSGKILDADMVILAVGVRPNIGVAQSAGLDIEDGFIKVNDYLQTSDPNIFAGGDLIKIRDFVTGKLVPSCMWQDAMLQGSYIVQNICSQMLDARNVYSGAVIVAQTHIFGLDIICCGNITNGKFEISEHFYKKINLPYGFLLVGCKDQFIPLKRQILAHIASR